MPAAKYLEESKSRLCVSIIMNTVRASTLRLRDIGGITSPDNLTYQAWRYPGRTPELEHDSGDMNLHIPGIVISRE